MNILRIRIIIKDSKIVLQFDQLELVVMRKWHHQKLGDSAVIKKTIPEWMMQDNAYSNPDDVLKSLQRTEIVDKRKIYQGEHVGKFSSTSYVLPTNPVLVLDFFSALNNYVNSIRFDEIGFSQFDLKDFILPNNGGDTFYLTRSIEDMANERVPKSFSLWPVLLERILTSTANDTVIKKNYRQILKVLNVTNTVRPKQTINPILETSKNITPSFADDFLTLDNRMEILLAVLGFPELNRPDLDSKSKVQALLALARKLIGADQVQTLEHVIDHFNLQSKKRLYHLLLNQLGPRGGFYDDLFIEWRIIKCAKFSLRADGCMSILLVDNEGYKEFSSSFARSYDFAQDLKYLVKALGLSLRSDSNFHEELIFDWNSTQELLRIGVQIDLEYLKNLLLVKNTAELFRQANTHATNSAGHVCLLNQLPRDVLHHITSYYYAPNNISLCEPEMRASKALGWNRFFFQPATNCWAEFSIDKHFSHDLGKLCDEFAATKIEGRFIKPKEHHVSLLFGFNNYEAAKLIEIVKKHMQTPLILTAGEITRGDVSQVILLHIEHSPQLHGLFRELYNSVGIKKHTLINNQYDPHITIAISDQQTLDDMDLTHYRDKFKGKTFTIDTIFAFDEDAQGKNILLDSYQAKALRLAI